MEKIPLRTTNQSVTKDLPKLIKNDFPKNDLGIPYRKYGLLLFSNPLKGSIPDPVTIFVVEPRK